MHLLFRTQDRALRGGHLHDLIDFFPRAFVDSDPEIAEVDRAQIFEGLVVVSNTLCSGLLLLHFFL